MLGLEGRYCDFCIISTHFYNLRLVIPVPPISLPDRQIVDNQALFLIVGNRHVVIGDVWSWTTVQDRLCFEQPYQRENHIFGTRGVRHSSGHIRAPTLNSSAADRAPPTPHHPNAATLPMAVPLQLGRAPWEPKKVT